ncbi:hypothetical protein Mucpa_2908 [Mucilaginibacter paludis DSM 18603]|uniref:Uncharacterized protein n=2 Tax=Mucilaginibacter TaxID=423349 RepID=H1YAH3_9SPHI|nr:hypothetical protein Mucpa_2908 [Mucilaginibacter paludis DSM 18603]
MEERELPMYRINDVDFFVEVSKARLREVGNPGNTISFIHNMTYNGNHYVLYYDPRLKNVADSIFDDGVAVVSLPMMSALDPDGMAQHYNRPMERVVGCADYDVMVDPQQMLKRTVLNELPVIMVLDHPFVVDIENDLYQPKHDIRTMGIYISRMRDDADDQQEFYHILYDPEQHRRIPVDWFAMTAIPEGLVVLELPHERVADPVGYAQKYNLDQRKLTMEFPPKAVHHARVIPWEQTQIPKVILANQKKERQQQKKRIRKKGKGLN